MSVSMPEVGPETRVVGVALLRDAPAPAVLAAHRVNPPGWELPGGKVEPGETPEQAAVREVGEELGCVVRVTGWLEGSVAIRPGLVLLAATAEVLVGEPMPRSGDHDALRWVPLEDLDDLAWLAPDLPFVAQLAARSVSTVSTATVEALVFERDHAEEVAARLRRGGYPAEVVRARFAGEDDEEDQPWAVRTEAPLVVAELAAEEFDGWVETVDQGRPTPARSPGLPLPDGPRRVKGHFAP